MDPAWKQIMIDIEPQGKSVRVGVEEETTVGDVIELLLDTQNNGGSDQIGVWAKRKVGDEFDFILVRKSFGNEELGYGMPFKQLLPEIDEQENFRLDVRPYVG